MTDRTAGTQQYRWIGRGVYTTAEASRLTGISAGRIRRWMQGYTFEKRGEVRNSPPVLSAELSEPGDESISLTFRDLIEAMCVDGFLKAGVRWPRLRKAHQRAAEVLGLDHPFATRKFLTDGHSVLLKVGDTYLLDLVSDQYALLDILRPYLKTEGLDFEGAFAARWWPMGKREPVIIDGARSFGQPIVKEGVPTLVLYRACLAEEVAVRSQSTRLISSPALPHAGPSENIIRYVADWYSVAPRSVKAAIEYEIRLAA
jgi:hypothetical protein